MTIPFKIYTLAIIKANVPTLNPLLSNIEANAVVVKKTMGVNNKKTKPATIRLLKLCWEREMVKKFRMLNITITKIKIINNCIPSDNFAPPVYIMLVYCIRKWKRVLL